MVSETTSALAFLKKTTTFSHVRVSPRGMSSARRRAWRWIVSAIFGFDDENDVKILPAAAGPPKNSKTVARLSSSMAALQKVLVEKICGTASMRAVTSPNPIWKRGGGNEASQRRKVYDARRQGNLRARANTDYAVGD